VLLNLQNQDVFFFQEPEVRQALLHGLDRQAIIDQQLGGQALIAHSPIIPGTWAYDDEIKRYAHDPDRAGELMDGIDWKRRGEDNIRFRNGKTLAFTLLTSSEPQKVEIAQAMAEQWEALGIPVTVETISPLDIPTRLERHDFEAMLIDLALPGDPDPYPFWHETQIEGGQNYAGFTNRRISEVTEQARVINSRDKREALYAEFQELFAQEVPALLLYIPVYTYGVDERIHNIQIAPLMHPADRFRTISDWWIVPRRVFVSEEQASQP
jgi:peptide/nickel transport system substrate-binding protein